jgi:hypothetical protein
MESKRARHRIGSALIVCSLCMMGVQVACNATQTQFDSGLPFMHTPMTVQSALERAGYLEADLMLNDRPLSAYSLPSQECLDVFAVGEEIDFVDSGPLGSFRRDEFRCQLIGRGKLAVWRDRSKRSSREPLPRAQANYRVIDSDDEVTFLRGSFPFAGRVGFSNSTDIVARVSNAGECKQVVTRTTSSMEYRQRGTLAFVLAGKNGVCEIDAFALPISPGQAAKIAEERAQLESEAPALD